MSSISVDARHIKLLEIRTIEYKGMWGDDSFDLVLIRTLLAVWNL